MNLGEKIYKLRNMHKMSQGDLAEKLNVSRQSISKWENNTSIPELDKLVLLSDIFHISLDDLVKGEDVFTGKEQISAKPLSTPNMESVQENGKTGEKKETDETKIPRLNEHTQETNSNNSMSTQKIIGFIMLAIGLLSCIMAFALGRGLMLIGGYLLMCSIICLLVKHNAGLVIGWTTFILAVLLATPFTGVRMMYVFHPRYWSEITMNHIVGVIMWIVLAVLVFFTYLTLLKKRRK